MGNWCCTIRGQTGLYTIVTPVHVLAAKHGDEGLTGSQLASVNDGLHNIQSVVRRQHKGTE